MKHEGSKFHNLTKVEQIEMKKIKQSVQHREYCQIPNLGLFNEPTENAI